MHIYKCVCVWLYSCIFTHRYTSAVVQSATHTWWVFQNHAHPPALLNKKTSDECQKYASLKNIDDINHLGGYLHCHCFENQLTDHYLTLTPNKCTTKFSQKIPIQHSQTTKKIHGFFDVSSPSLDDGGVPVFMTPPGRSTRPRAKARPPGPPPAMMTRKGLVHRHGLKHQTLIMASYIYLIIWRYVDFCFKQKIGFHFLIKDVVTGGFGLDEFDLALPVQKRKQKIEKRWNV